jgi:hypothetical protein
VINIIKKTDGTKRARVKDGIILNCIYYVSKNKHMQISFLAKKLNLDMKYVTRAEKLIVELINSKKLIFEKSFLETNSPYTCVNAIIQKKNIKIDVEILQLFKKLINICEENDILLDHTPNAIGVCCLYYIFCLKNINIDAKKMGQLFSLSPVTILKTFNKLNVHDEKINKLLES